MAQTLVIGGFLETSGWVIGVVGLVLAYYQWRRERTATAAVAVERKRFEGLELLRALDEMDRHFVELQHENAAGHNDAAEAALRRWREAVRSARTHVGSSGTGGEASRRMEYAERRSRAMAGLGGEVNVGAKTMGDAIDDIDSCQSVCAQLRVETQRAVYGA
jgi:hypothetical protein